MKVTLNNARVINIPDQPPTPQVIFHDGITYTLSFDNNYTPVAHYKTKGSILVNAHGSPVIGGKE